MLCRIFSLIAVIAVAAATPAPAAVAGGESYKPFPVPYCQYGEPQCCEHVGFGYEPYFLPFLNIFGIFDHNIQCGGECKIYDGSFQWYASSYIYCVVFSLIMSNM